MLPQTVVKAAGLGKGNRSHNAVAVNNVKAEDERNFKAALLNCDALKMLYIAAVVKPEEGTDFPFSDPLLLFLKALTRIFGPLDVIFRYTPGLKQLLLLLFVNRKAAERGGCKLI